MANSPRLIAPSIVALLVAVTAPALTAPQTGPSLVVHEWGTFTSVAGEDGRAVSWQPLDGPSELPCFVNRFALNIKGSLSGLVRMETPVLYFYTPSDTTVGVDVRFKSGLVTEWYPRADVQRLGGTSGGPLLAPGVDTKIEWPRVHIVPGAPARFPDEDDASHYYAARQTDASPLDVAGQHEKFLFYRGVGDFEPPLAATVDPDGSVAAKSAGGQVPAVMLFERANDRFGYRLVRAMTGSRIIEPPELSADRVSIEDTLRQALVEAGLFAKEADAMVATWRDSWFEPGARLIYIVPPSTVDAVLPLSVTPRPAATTRVFVGRLELLTPDVAQTIDGALSRSDVPLLEQYGRFLRPFAARVIAHRDPTVRAQSGRLLDMIRPQGVTFLNACH